MKNLLLVLLCVLGLGLAAVSQKAPAPTPTPTPLPVRGMGNEAKLQIRDLQHKQDQIVIEIQRLQRAHEQLQAQLNDIVTKEASGLKVDMTKYVFDLDTLQYTERPAAKK